MNNFNSIANDFNFPETSKILDILRKHEANHQDPSNLPKAIHNTAVELGKNYKGHPAKFDNQMDDIQNAIKHIWETRPKTQHSIGSEGDDMPMIGNGIQSRFESFQNWLESKEERIKKYEKKKRRKDGKHQESGYVGGNPKYRDRGDKREHPEDSRNVSGSNKNIDTSHM
jgi:hypothetical protein